MKCSLVTVNDETGEVLQVVDRPVILEEHNEKDLHIRVPLRSEGIVGKFIEINVQELLEKISGLE